MRPAQSRALIGAALLLCILSGEPATRAQGDELPPVGDGFQATADVRPWLASQLQRRNPRLGAHRSQRIADAVMRCTQRHKQLTPQLVLAVMLQESNARPGVTSAKGAVGLMQVMPHMYYEVLDMPGSIGHLESNVEAGCLLLADNIRRLGRRAGISSYFWGSVIVSDSYVKGVETILRDLERSPRGADAPG